MTTQLIWDDNQYWETLYGHMFDRDLRLIDIATYSITLTEMPLHVLATTKEYGIKCRLMIGTPPIGGFHTLKVNTSFESCVLRAANVKNHLNDKSYCRILPVSHLKCVIFHKKNPIVMLGGRNFSPSTMLDCTIYTDEKSIAADVIMKYNEVWKSAIPLDKVLKQIKSSVDLQRP